MITVDRLNGLDLSAPGNDIVTLKKKKTFFYRIGNRLSQRAINLFIIFIGLPIYLVKFWVVSNNYGIKNCKAHGYTKTNK